MEASANLPVSRPKTYRHYMHVSCNHTDSPVYLLPESLADTDTLVWFPNINSSSRGESGASLLNTHSLFLDVYLYCQGPSW